MTLLGRFLAKVELGDDCWEWTGYRDRGGYGRFSLNGHSRPAHRVAWELLVGALNPPLVLDHLCRNRGCVKPGHLEETTIGENVKRGGNSLKTACPRGHPYQGWNPTGFRFCPTCNNAGRRLSSP